MIDMEKSAYEKDSGQRTSRAYYSKYFEPNAQEDAAKTGNADYFESDEIPEPQDLWQLGTGTFVILGGVVLPLVSLLVALSYSFEGIWRLTILHPVETLLEAFFLISVPLANYWVWHSICHKDLRHPIRNGIFNGIAIAVPAITALISILSFALQYPLIDTVNRQPHDLSIGLMGFVSLPPLAAAIYLALSLRSAKQTRVAKLRTVFYSLAGVLLTILGLAAAEARSTFIRITETMALSDDASEREAGLSMLRGSNPEKELKISCADPHAAGLAGMFLPLDSDAQKRLFFAATGKAYRDYQSTNMSLMSNDYLRNHVVGETVNGLSLHRSALHGVVHGKSLSSTIDWTFVFKNKSYVNQEARAELALPEGAVISDLTLWINGSPRKAAFSPTEQAKGAYNWINVQHRDPALVTDLGRGRYLLQAKPVPGQGEMKVKISITEPMKVDGTGHAFLGVPRFIDKNFSLAGQHSIMLKSDQKLTSGLKTLKPTVTADGVKLLSGSLKEDEITSSTFAVKLDEAVNFKTLSFRDPFKKSGNNLLCQQLKTRSSSAPKHLVVVVDSSKAVADKVDDIIASLRKIPASVQASILLASDKETAEFMSLEEGLKALKSNNFGGGQDNLFALVKAAERAGSSSGGAVLWVHGAQPGYNNEMYIMAPYASAPSFYEMALDDCLTDANEFFKNHKEIGPFAAIPRSGPLADDLNSFLSKWQPGAKETYIDISETQNATAELIEDKACAAELAVLNAAEKVKNLLSMFKSQEAAVLAAKYRIVSPVSGAVVLENSDDYRRFQTATPEPSPDAESAAQTQSNVLADTQLSISKQLDRLNHVQAYSPATNNSTLAQQGIDTQMITGINTSGTVRVNNIANLEALLNIIANLLEIIGIPLGAYQMIMGAMGRKMLFPFNSSAKGRICVGVAVILLALACPTVINWMLASARDANLFS